MQFSFLHIYFAAYKHVFVFRKVASQFIVFSSLQLQTIVSGVWSSSVHETETFLKRVLVTNRPRFFLSERIHARHIKHRKPINVWLVHVPHSFYSHSDNPHLSRSHPDNYHFFLLSYLDMFIASEAKRSEAKRSEARVPKAFLLIAEKLLLHAYMGIVTNA